MGGGVWVYIPPCRYAPTPSRSKTSLPSLHSHGIDKVMVDKTPYTLVKSTESRSQKPGQAGSGQLHHSPDRVNAVVSEEPVLVAACFLEVEERGVVNRLLGVGNAVPHLADVDGRHARYCQNALRVVVEVAQLVNQVPVSRDNYLSSRDIVAIIIRTAGSVV